MIVNASALPAGSDRSQQLQAVSLLSTYVHNMNEFHVPGDVIAAFASKMAEFCGLSERQLDSILVFSGVREATGHSDPVLDLT